MSVKVFFSKKSIFQKYKSLPTFSVQTGSHYVIITPTPNLHHPWVVGLRGEVAGLLGLGGWGPRMVRARGGGMGVIMT